MNNNKKLAKFALRFLGVTHLFIAAACWRMNGIWNERTFYEDNGSFIARGYLFVALGALISGLLILASVQLLKGSGKHRA